MTVTGGSADRDAESEGAALPRIGGPATGALAHIGITTLGQVAELSERELLGLHGVGPKAVGILRVALAERGLSFRSP